MTRPPCSRLALVRGTALAESKCGGNTTQHREAKTYLLTLGFPLSLAYAEMRLILAKILYRFDVELAPEARGWLDEQKIYGLWDKPSLPFYLRPAEGTA